MKNNALINKFITLEQNTIVFDLNTDEHNIHM